METVADFVRLEGVTVADVQIFCGCRDRPQIARLAGGVFSYSRSSATPIEIVGSGYKIAGRALTADEFAALVARGDMSPVCHKCKKAHDLLRVLNKALIANRKELPKLVV